VLTYIEGYASLLASANVSSRFMGCGQLEGLVLYAASFVIMMSQNRQAEKDRLTAQNDYQTDCKGEEEVRHIMDHLDHQDDLILQIVKRLEEQHMEMREQLARLDTAMAKQLRANVQQMVVEREEQEHAEQ
jgi:uncharacterized membrane protein